MSGYANLEGTEIGGILLNGQFSSDMWKEIGTVICQSRRTGELVIEVIFLGIAILA